jgi:hypothetical protein
MNMVSPGGNPRLADRRIATSTRRLRPIRPGNRRGTRLRFLRKVSAAPEQAAAEQVRPRCLRSGATYH